MDPISIRTATGADAPLLRKLAAACPPLDLHTPYTYWVACQYHGDSIFILEDKGTPVGYTMALNTPECVFLWQIGILPGYRSRNLSQVLIGKVMDFAAAQKKCVRLTIAPENKASFAALSSYCRQHDLPIQTGETLHLIDYVDQDFSETEVIYTVNPY